VGFDTPASLGDRQSAATVALPIWARFMGQALAYFPAREFPVPPGITFARVDPSTGKEVPPGGAGGMTLPFRLGTVPEAALATKPSTPRKGAGEDLM
jgi:penicillin-binding protein 1A